MYKTTITDETGKTIFEATGKTVLLVQHHEDEEGGGCYGFAIIDGNESELLNAMRALDHLQKEVYQKYPEVKAMRAVEKALGPDEGQVTDLSGLMQALIEREDDDE